MLASIAEREQFRSIYAAKVVKNSNPHKLFSRKYTNPHYFFIIKITQSPQIVAFLFICSYFPVLSIFHPLHGYERVHANGHVDPSGYR